MLRVVACLGLLAAVNAIPIDNGVQGDPEIECGPTSIQVTFNTQNNFEGHVYVKGLYDLDGEGCRTTGDGARAVGSIELPFDTCQVERVRSANPKGIFVRTTLVISFHPNFITKVDRAYTLQCFYMEADKTVSTDIEVSMITTGFQTQFVPMPICRYEILDAPDGNIVQFALIGQAVYHKWTCDTETIDTFCMYVYSCFVVDPAGIDRLDLIGEDGCATDRYLMGNIEYPSDLMGVKEVHVFKYADRPALFFQCQIQITVKEPNAECIRPECQEPGGSGDGSGSGAANVSGARGKRSVARLPSGETVDVRSGVEILDIQDSNAVLPEDLAHRAPASRHLYAPVVVSQQEGFCMSPVTLAVFVVAALAVAAATVTVALLKSNQKQ
jgi:hypothetical protein